MSWTYDLSALFFVVISAPMYFQGYYLISLILYFTGIVFYLKSEAEDTPADKQEQERGK